MSANARFAQLMAAAAEAARNDPGMRAGAGMASLPPASLFAPQVPAPGGAPGGAPAGPQGVAARGHNATRRRTEPWVVRYANGRINYSATRAAAPGGAAQAHAAAPRAATRGVRRARTEWWIVRYASGRINYKASYARRDDTFNIERMVEASDIPEHTPRPVYNTSYELSERVTVRRDKIRTYKFGMQDFSLANVRRLLGALPARDRRSTNFQFLASRPGEDHTWSCGANSRQDLLRKIDDFLIETIQNYEGNIFDVRIPSLGDNEISISVTEKNPEIGLGAARSLQQASKKWLIVSRASKTNCLYQALQMTRFPARFDEYDKDHGMLVDHAKKLKLRANPENKAFSDNATLQHMSTYLKSTIILYNNLFQEIERFEPVAREPNGKRVRLDKKVVRPPLEIQIRDNHYIPLLRYVDIGRPEPTDEDLRKDEERRAAEEEARKEAEAMKEAVKITKRPDQFLSETLDTKIAAWDLEASPNGTADGAHKCYAAGVAWYEGEEIRYESFWGLDALPRFMDFLTEEQDRFHGYTFYAHNGGKYDLPMLMREALCNDTRWRIVPGSLIEVNCRWVNLAITSSKGKKITFKDSVAMLPGSLEKLCKDFSVVHQKLAETVRHDEITIQNWNTFPQLPRYLEHDCKGLLEVVTQFSRDVFQASSRDFVLSREAICRQAFEHFTGKPFAQVRPPWLGLSAEEKAQEKKDDLPRKSLELDGFNEELMVAFEWNGLQHYERLRFFHQSQADFERQLRYDARKAELCVKKGVKLFTIDARDFQTPAEIAAHVKDLLTAHGAMSNDNPFIVVRKNGGINITSCVSGANLSKKWYYASCYNEKNTPIFTLTAKEDEYIRRGYYGGRVEIFKLGKIEGPLYYLDFTSLYPSMGKHDLPYGKPVFHSDLSNGLPEDFFGFVRCRVRSTDFTRKPLHAYMDHDGGKLLFPYFKEWTEMDLFSEEVRRGMAEGMYEYEFVDGYAFRRAPVMKDFFESLFRRKASASAEGKKALAQVFKIILNSGYGFWGLRTRGRDGIALYQKGADAADFYKHLEAGTLKSYGEHGQYTVLRMEKDLPTTDFNVGIASAITSWARMTLWGLLDDIEKAGARVYMCDTDSVITSCKINDYPQLMAKYMWDGCGEALGALKNEADDVVGGARAEVAAREGGLIHFDSGYLGGCKFYALRKTLADGTNIDICKCKGFSKGERDEEGRPVKLVWEDFVRMSEGGVLKQKQTQWRCGRGNYVSETASDFCAMRTPQVEKSFGFLYTKGQIQEDGNITPHTI